MIENQINRKNLLIRLADKVQFPLRRGIEVSERVVLNIRDAQNYWSLWEALNNRLEHDMPLANSLKWHMPRGFNAIRQALIHCTILSITRAIDNPRSRDTDSDSMSACILSGLLRNTEVTEVLTGDDWLRAEKSDIPLGILEFEREAQPKRISWFIATVPFGWGKNDFPPDETSLKQSRDALINVRDRMLAHSLQGNLDLPTVNQVREALRITCEVARHASLIFLRHSSGLNTDLTDKTRGNGEFWDFFEGGLVSSHQDWLDEYRRLEATPDKQAPKQA